MKAIITLAVLCILTSCGTEEVSDNHQRRLNPIDLQNLEIGQQNQYIRYYSETAYDESTIKYTGDTLIVEIIKIEGNNISILEKLTPYSPSLALFPTREALVSIFADRIEQDSCSTFAHSSIILNRFDSLSFESSDTLMTTIGDWKSDDSRGDHTLETELNSQTYEYLIMKFTRLSICDYIITHGPSRTMLYSKKHFIVKAIFEQPWTGFINGWDLISK